MFKTPEIMTIGTLAAKMGMRTSALRYYESVGILPAPQRESGQRRYEVSVLKQLEVIQAAQKAGFSIKEIRVLLNSSEDEMPYSERLQKLARHKLTQVEALIAQAHQQKAVLEASLRCHCSRLEDCSLFVSRSV